MIKTYWNDLFEYEFVAVQWNGDNYDEIAQILGGNPIVDVDTGVAYFRDYENDCSYRIEIGKYITLDKKFGFNDIAVCEQDLFEKAFKEFDDIEEFDNE